MSFNVWKSLIDGTEIDVSAIPDSVVSRWLLNEGSGTTAEDDVGDNDGSVTGATWESDGTVGDYLDFSGGDDEYVTVPYDSELDVDDQTGFTISVWLYLEGDPSENATVFSNHDSDADNGYTLQLGGENLANGNETRRVVPRFGERSYFSDSDSVDDFYDHIVPVGEWHHLSIAAEGEEARLIAHDADGNEEANEVLSISDTNGWSTQDSEDHHLGTPSWNVGGDTMFGGLRNATIHDAKLSESEQQDEHQRADWIGGGSGN